MRKRVAQQRVELVVSELGFVRIAISTKISVGSFLRDF